MENWENKRLGNAILPKFKPENGISYPALQDPLCKVRVTYMTITYDLNSRRVSSYVSDRCLEGQCETGSFLCSYSNLRICCIRANP